MSTRRDSNKPTGTSIPSLATVFSEDAITRTIRRMRSRRDNDDLITHPLKRIVLTEYESDLAGQLATEVAVGTYTPESAYSCTVTKGSGGYRDLVFPSLVDSIVARHAVDILERHIVHPDNDRVFCSRAHANTTRHVGDYERWFQVWRDYAASIAQACRERGYTYVFETDVADFFLSIDRHRARSELERRTGAPSSIAAFLFHCLEAWLVRRSYERGPGLPIEPHDISRLIAHNYLKGVDEEMSRDSTCTYLRFMDDTVVFVADKHQAEAVKRKHYAALSEMGLAPNSAKTTIVSTDQYEVRRHVEVNRKIDELDDSFREVEFETLVTDWYSRREGARHWSRVTKRIYTLARKKQSEFLRDRAVDDLLRNPELADHALRYLSDMVITKSELDNLLEAWKDRSTDSERLIGITRFLCDVRFSFAGGSKQLSDFALYRIRRNEDRPGGAYARALMLLVLYKHGKREQRDKVSCWAKSQRLTDPQIRHYLYYVFSGTDNVDAEILNRMRPLGDSDVELTVRVCRDGRSGSLREHRRLLDACVSHRRIGAVIEARFLPFLRIMLENEVWREENEKWIKRQLSAGGARRRVCDEVVREMLQRILNSIVD